MKVIFLLEILAMAIKLPQSLLYKKKDSDDTKERKRLLRGFILRLFTWFSDDFFENIDICEEALLYNSIGHISFAGFVTMETRTDGNMIYRAMEVEESRLLKERSNTNILQTTIVYWKQPSSIRGNLRPSSSDDGKNI